MESATSICKGIDCILMKFSHSLSKLDLSTILIVVFVFISQAAADRLRPDLVEYLLVSTLYNCLCLYEFAFSFIIYI